MFPFRPKLSLAGASVECAPLAPARVERACSRFLPRHSSARTLPRHARRRSPPGGRPPLPFHQLRSAGHRVAVLRAWLRALGGAASERRPRGLVLNRRRLAPRALHRWRCRRARPPRCLWQAHALIPRRATLQLRSARHVHRVGPEHALASQLVGHPGRRRLGHGARPQLRYARGRVRGRRRESLSTHGRGRRRGGGGAAAAPAVARGAAPLHCILTRRQNARVRRR